MTHFVSHLLVAYVVLVEPWLGSRLYSRLKTQVAAGDITAKVRFYRMIVLHQVIATALVIGILYGEKIPAGDFGLRLPVAGGRWMGFMAGFLPTAIIGIFLLRKKGQRLIAKMEETVGALLPHSTAERTWFAGVSLGAGISEELVFRGFLLYYIAVNLPAAGLVSRVILAAIIFGICHFYQGWQGVLGTAILGAVFAGLYVETGSLLFPAILHALIDLRILILIPARPTATAIVLG